MFPVEYKIERTEAFAEWFESIAKSDRNRLTSRIERMRSGNFGDHKELAENLFELRCFFGGGLRVYYTIYKDVIVLLLSGGNKDTQKRDIKRARDMLGELTEE